MCGIFGVLSTKDRLTLQQESFVKDCTLVDQLRGEDGTGLLTVEKDGSFEVYRSAVAGADFFSTRAGVASKRGIALAKMVIGHNRKGTTGGSSRDACHPFPYDKVTGVHNGTIPWASLERLDAKDAVSSVDSAKVYAALNKAKSPTDVLSMLHTGSYVLVWANHEHGTLNFARNSDRPLWLASGEDGLYWASEPGMLVWLMARYGLQGKQSKLWELPVDTLYTIPIATPKAFTKVKYVVKGITAAKPMYDHSNYNRGYQQQSWFTGLKDTSRSYRSVALMKAELHGASDLIESLEENIDCVREQDTAIPKWTDLVDVVVMTYKGGSAWGYIQDEAETGMCIPVRMYSVPTNFGLREKIDDDFTKMKSFPTVRGEISNIKVYPTGQAVVTVVPGTLWTKESNMPACSTTTAASDEIMSVWAEESVKRAPTELAEMWKLLQTKPLQHIRQGA